MKIHRHLQTGGGGTSTSGNYWLIGSGMPVLAAAVYLVEAGVRGCQIHVWEPASHSSKTPISHGNAKNGFIVHTSIQPFLFEPCFKDMLRLIPCASQPGKHLLDVVQNEKMRNEAYRRSRTRLIQVLESGPIRKGISGLKLAVKDRISLGIFMLRSEKSLEHKSIRQCFDEHFFESSFWVVWSSTFAIRTLHSAVEFQRQLCKYLANISQLNEPYVFGNIQYTFQDSILRPMIEHLERAGVAFAEYTDINIQFCDAAGSGLTISQITKVSETEEILVATVEQTDVVIAHLGPATTVSIPGSHGRPPARHRQKFDSETQTEWQLWDQLTERNPRLGNPSNFRSRLSETTVVTFTITIRDPSFISLWSELTQNPPGAAAFVTVTNSKWCLTLNIPQQPVFPNQPEDVEVAWGYGLTPEQDGNYIAKPMYTCSGEEILMEVLAHLRLPRDPILSSSTVIPCLLPFATLPVVTRTFHDRARVSPEQRANLLVIGPFVEVPSETASGMDYNVRGAQIAVHMLQGLQEKVSKSTHRFIRAFDVLKL